MRSMEPLMKTFSNTETSQAKNLLNLETLQSNDFLARMSLAAVKTPGVAEIYENVLGFEGDEFYTKVWPQTVGLKFGQMAEHFPAAIPVGIMDRNGKISMVPSNDTILEENMALVVIAEDDDKYDFRPDPPFFNEGLLPGYMAPQHSVDKLLICGWGENLRVLLKTLNVVYDPGTEVHLCNRLSVEERKSRMESMPLESLELKVRRKVSLLISFYFYHCALPWFTFLF